MYVRVVSVLVILRNWVCHNWAYEFPTLVCINQHYGQRNSLHVPFSPMAALNKPVGCGKMLIDQLACAILLFKLEPDVCADLPLACAAKTRERHIMITAAQRASPRRIAIRLRNFLQKAPEASARLASLVPAFPTHYTSAFCLLGVEEGRCLGNAQAEM